MLQKTTAPIGLLESAVATRAFPGQANSGDLHLISPFNNGALVAVVDGVGHGEEATDAARRAVATLAAHPEEPVIRLVKRCHVALAETRGAVMTLVAIHALEATLTWIGVGNVEGMLLRADPLATPPVERVLLRGGMVGYQLPLLGASVVSIGRGDLLILATDGIRPELLERQTFSAESAQSLAERLLANCFKGTDDGLVLVARFKGLAL